MIWRGILVLLALALPARGETVVVQSGEHPGFARIVLDLAAPAGWRMTRDADGYVLAIDRADLRFDVTDVHRRISRDRLAAIWADPVTGALHLGVGCACHAIAFELRPDVLVIDLRDGPAPEGSAFERAADGSTLPALTARAPQRPQPRPARLTGRMAARVDTPGPEGADAAAGYDWMALEGLVRQPGPDAARPAGQPAPGQPAPGQPATPAAPAGLRDALLTEISRAMAQGTVDPAAGMPPPRQREGSAAAPDPGTELPAGLGVVNAGALARDHIRIAGTPGQPGSADPGLTAEGRTCTPDAVVDVAAWGDDRPVAAALGDRTARLYGEFDQVDVAAAERAVRYYLHLGFGAEARRLAGSLGLQSPDRPVWEAMARILDGAPDRPGPFDGMAGCDGAVAMWALLAQAGTDARDSPATPAILRSFSALPPHLRRHLGPTLADRYLARGETGPVRAIRDAIKRPGGTEDPAVTLMSARLDRANGADPDLAVLDALQAAPGRTGVAATIDAIDAARNAPEPINAGLVTGAEALLREHRGTEDEPALRAALARGLALQGSFDAAFAMAAAAGDDPRPIWAILAERGPDSAILAQAVRDPADGLPDIAPEDRRRLARRLIDLGLGTPARLWLDAAAAGAPDLPEADLLLAAEAYLAGRDARAALRLLAGADGAAASALRSAAYLMLDAPAGADMPAADRARLARQQGDWTTVAGDGATPWADAAALATAPPETVSAATAVPGSLARAGSLIDESTAARATLEALLQAVPPPDDGGS